ncbi:unnamed protein product, partial [Prorocentrum cordatum]
MRGNHAGQGGAAKVRGASAGDSRDDLALRLLAVASQLTLKRALEIRELQAATFRVSLLPASAPAVQAMKSATAPFAEGPRAAAARKGTAPAGEPHAHAWAAWAMNAVKKTFDKGHVKVYLATKSTPDCSTLAGAAIGHLLKQGGKEKTGQAPRGGNERPLQTLHDQLKEVVGDKSSMTDVE